MTVYKDTLALIGNTPLVRLKGPSEATGCDIFGKCEFANPGASVKDRAALYIVKDAEEKRSEEHTSELQSLMRISYAVFCLKNKTNSTRATTVNQSTGMCRWK